MIIKNISLGEKVTIDPTASVNNVDIGEGVKIAKNCSIYGAPENILEIGANSYVGMNTILNGFVKKLNLLLMKTEI